jgi:type-F conjugative transfer system pilin assembly thiol-disulfide isomerase TrbB
MFMYKESCPHCHNFAPVLADFSKTFKLSIEGYSLDGKALAPFEATPLTPELFQTLYVAGDYQPVVPALFLVNKHTLQANAVLFGEATPYELAKRVHELMQHIGEQFHD